MGSEQEKSVSLDVVLSWFKEAVENKQPIPPSAFLDAATKLTVLLEDLDDELVTAEMEVNRAVRDFMLEDESAASAKIMAKGLPCYEQLLRLQAKRERVQAFCQLAKKRVEARL